MPYLFGDSCRANGKKVYLKYARQPLLSTITWNRQEIYKKKQHKIWCFTLLICSQNSTKIRYISSEWLLISQELGLIEISRRHIRTQSWKLETMFEYSCTKPCSVITPLLSPTRSPVSPERTSFNEVFYLWRSIFTADGVAAMPRCLLGHSVKLCIYDSDPLMAHRVGGFIRDVCVGSGKTSFPDHISRHRNPYFHSIRFLSLRLLQTSHSLRSSCSTRKAAWLITLLKSRQNFPPRRSATSENSGESPGETIISNYNCAKV